ncbi:GNAT family N-acetyltransferase [Pseudarthrobacter sp. J1738]|uniref:GNAT family N-acetyltransferase n=1 Tax=unclassified Pseudarthrobacter TaxID=2647000 RepID=UPI003D2CDFA5
MFGTAQLSNGVYLRMLKHSDSELLAAAYSANQQHLAPWDPLRTPEFFTPRGQSREIVSKLSQYDAGTALPLILATDDEIVGSLNLSGIVRGPFQSANLGYWIDAGLTGQGVMGQAVKTVAEYAKETMGLHRIQAGTLVHNEASQRVLAKNGFEYFGTAPKYLKIADQWQDHKLFQLILE